MAPKLCGDPVDAHVGVRIRLRRVLLGISQERLAKPLGLTYQQMQKYESGRNRVTAGRLYALAGLLGVSVTYFYDGLPAGLRSPDPIPAGGQAGRVAA
jgi:transcriptional regulator with XRE-family HTH domain